MNAAIVLVLVLVSVLVSVLVLMRRQDDDERSQPPSSPVTVREAPANIPITTQYLQELQRVMTVLRPFVETLLAETALTDNFRLSRKPVGFEEFSRMWRELFASAGTHQDKISAIYQTIIDQLFEVKGDWVGPSIYSTLENWLHTQTPQPAPARPRITLGLIGFVAAVHNWLWWYRAASRNDSGESDETHWIAGLEQDVDHFLNRLIKLEAALEVGDLIAIHLIAEKLRGLFIPLPREPVVIRLTAEGVVQHVRGGDSRTRETLPEPFQARLDTISMISPIARLSFSGARTQPSAVPMCQAWPGVGKLFSASSAAGVRQYVSSRLSTRLIQRTTTPAQVHDILATISAVDTQLASLPAHVVATWRTFVATILWATLDYSDGDQQHGDFTWLRWSEGYPEHCTLAQWSGRLAYHAERIACNHKPYEYPELIWQWVDLARVTLKPWITQRDYAVLCLGLWLDGYLEDRNDIPSLKLATRITDFPLDQVILHWESAADREIKSGGSTSLATEEHGRLIQSLQRLRDQLAARPAYAASRPSIRISAIAAPPVGDRAALADVSGEPIARIIQYNREQA